MPIKDRSARNAYANAWMKQRRAERQCVMNKEIVYLTTSQIAEQFGVHSSTVRRWVILGRITPTQTTLGGHYRFTHADIMRSTLLD